MNARAGETVSAGNTNADNLNIIDKRQSGINNIVTYFPKVISGTVQFAIGSAPTVNHRAWSSTDTIPPFECYPGELWFKQTAGGDSFVVV